jgi:hypothetical protein
MELPTIVRYPHDTPFTILSRARNEMKRCNVDKNRIAKFTWDIVQCMSTGGDIAEPEVLVDLAREYVRIIDHTEI